MAKRSSNKVAKDNVKIFIPEVVDENLKVELSEKEDVKPVEKFEDELKAPKVDDSALSKKEVPVVKMPVATAGKVNVHFTASLDRCFILNGYVSAVKGETKNVTIGQADILRAKKYII